MANKLKKEDIIPSELIQKTVDCMASIIDCHIALKEKGWGSFVPTTLSHLSDRMCEDAKRGTGHPDRFRLLDSVDQSIKKVSV